MGNFIFVVFFLTFGIMCIVIPETMLKYRLGLKKKDKINFEWYWKLLMCISGVCFILVGMMMLV